MKYLKFKNSTEQVHIGKIVCVGRNYAEHAKELGNEIPDFPLIFLKPASNVIFSDEDIVQPAYSNELHHEVELVLYIDKEIKNADDKSAEDSIGGYTVGLDMTLRDLQSELKRKGEPWTLAKCFDTSAVLADVVLKSNYKLNGREKISLSVNGTIKQDSDLSKMIFTPVEIVKYISSKMKLEKGDLIFTGTPEGVGKVIPCDKIEASIENIGTLSTQISK